MGEVWLWASILLVGAPCLFEDRLSASEKMAMFLFAPSLLAWYLVAFVKNGRWPHRDIFS